MFSKLTLLARKILFRMSYKFASPSRVKITQTEICGFKLLVLANEDVGREIVYLRQYESKDTNMLASLIRPTDICCDIGANTGYYTMLMAAKAPSGQVHSFEPLPLNWHLLCCGVLLNGFDHVAANHFALSDHCGEAKFSAAIDGAYSSLIPVGRKAESSQISVKVETLDNYISSQGIPRVDVIKVDVEGAEEMVLRGAINIFGLPEKRPRVAMLELDDRNLAPYKTSVSILAQKMAEFGYQPFFATPDNRLCGFEPKHHNVHCNVFFLSAGTRKEMQEQGRITD